MKRNQLYLDTMKDQPVEKEVPQTPVEKPTSSSLRRVGTIYGSSLLKTLQSPRRIKQNQIQAAKQGSQQAAQSAQPSTSQTSAQSTVQGTSLLTGQKVPIKQASAGQQICLKFARVTRPDGKPGLAAIIAASPTNQQGSSSKAQVTQQQKSLPTVQQQKAQQQKAQQQKAQQQKAQQQKVQAQTQLAIVNQIPLPTSPSKRIGKWSYKKKPKAQPKSVPGSTDETQQAIDGLIASENGGDSESTAQEARVWNFEKRRELNKDELAKTEKLLKVLRTLENRQKAQIEGGVSQESQVEVNQQNQPSEVNQQSQVNQQHVKTKTTLQQSQRAVAERQLQRLSIKQEFIDEEAPQPPTYRPNRPPPHQLPPDNDRLGLDQAAANRRQKNLTHQTKKKKKPKPVSPDVASRYMESLLAPKLPGTIFEKAREERAARDFPGMINNIDVFMFPVYRCKQCPNYYSTVKSTIVEHMKEIHKWSRTGQVDYPAAPAESENVVVESVQDRVKNIQNIFERKLRNQSTSGDVELGVELEPVSSSVEKPLGSEITGSGIIGCGINEQVVREESSDDDVGGCDLGGFDDDDDDGTENAEAFDKVNEKSEPVSSRKSLRSGFHTDQHSIKSKQTGRFVKLSSTPMIRNYPHRDSSSLSSARNPKKTKAVVMLKDVLENKRATIKKSLPSKEVGGKGQLEHIENEDHEKTKESATIQSLSDTNSKVSKKDKAKKRAKKAESSDDDVDDRDLSEVKPKDSMAQVGKLKTKEPKKKLSKYELKKRKRENYFKCGPMNYMKNLAEERRKARNNEGKTDDSVLKPEIAENVSEDNLISDKSKVNPDVPVRRHTTRSVAKSKGGLVEPGPQPEDVTATGKKKIRMSRYEAWKKIGLDPNSEPPWPCSVPDCNTYFTQLSSILTHHCFTHDTFGDRKQRLLARSLGEKYSLFEKREKRAVQMASSSEDDDEDDDAGTVKGKSKRRKTAPERFSEEFANVEGSRTRGRIPPKRVQCGHCRRWFANDFGLQLHKRSMHTKKWMEDNNLTPEDVAEINKTIKKEDTTSANISLLANVADKLDDINLECRKCGYKAKTEHSLRLHKNRSHPQYVKSMYSDSESEGDEPITKEKEDADNEDVQLRRSSTTSRPVRNCRRKSYSDMMVKEKKLDKVVPEILPDHAIYGEVLEEEDERDVDDGGRDGPLLQCQECNFVGIREDGFVMHMKKMHDQDVVLKFQCEHCDFFGTRREVTDHKKSLHVETILCEVCGKACKGQTRLERHQQFYCGKKKVKKQTNQNVTKACQICGRIFHNLSTLCYHMQCHKNLTFTCDVCQKTFNHKAKLNSHKVSHRTEAYHCDHCEYKTHYKGHLQQHLYTKHNIGEETIRLRKCRKVEGCTFTTKNLRQLHRHYKKHNLKRFKYWCDTCQQSVKTLKCLAKHQVIHRDGDEKFKCDICGHQTTSKNTLISHKDQAHTVHEKILMCSLCGESFAKPAQLKNHNILKHTNIKPVKCKAEGCDRTFKYHADRNKHFREDHKELAEAEEIAKVELARQIINAPPKVKKIRVKKPRKKRIYKSKGVKPGPRPKPLTPELKAHREALTRARNKRRYEVQKAKMTRLGFKRRKYKKGEPRWIPRDATCKGTCKHATKSANRDFDQEVVTAAQQLENIAQSFPAETQPQHQESAYQSPQHSAAPNPVQVEHMDATFGQPTALHHEYNRGSGGIATTSSYSQPIASQEVVVSSEMQAIEDLARTLAQDSLHQASSSSYTTQRIVQGYAVDGSPTHAGDQPKPGEKPVSFLEVTTVHSDGKRKVDMFPVWDK